MKIPASIPKQYHKYIAYIEKEDGFSDDETGNDCKKWVVQVKNYTVDRVIPCHIIIEKTLKDAVMMLENGEPCNCDDCSNLQ